MIGPKLKINYNSTLDMAPHVHGKHKKDMIVLHETVSPDIKGLADITGVEKYLARKDYGIHGMTDAEGYNAWALGLGQAIFYQAGGVNERSIGIEQVSDIPSRYRTNAQRKEAWGERDKQLRATAKLIACICRAHGIPLVASDGLHPGITSHWNVSQHFASSEGHTDCHPTRNGGYYPLDSVISVAKTYYRLRYHF
jgi:hypothetical protein